MRTPAFPILPFALTVIALLSLSLPSLSQTAQTSAPVTPVVPQLVKFDGIAAARPSNPVEAVFRIYLEPEGGEALWTESQRIAVAADGKYSVLLGAASEGGLPQSVFAAGQARWLGVSIEGSPARLRRLCAQSRRRGNPRRSTSRRIRDPLPTPRQSALSPGF